jgi:hypothetical protein
MKTNPYTVLLGSMRLSAALAGSMFLGACDWHHHHHDEDRTVIVDEHGWRHEGFYDENHAWHGGYVDDHGEHHDDPADWHH